MYCKHFNIGNGVDSVASLISNEAKSLHCSRVVGDCELEILFSYDSSSVPSTLIRF